MKQANLRAIMDEIREEHGRLTPPIVLAVASDPTHPLHHRFEWDDTVAGERYRLQQAHGLITEVRVEYRAASGSVEAVRAFHAIRAADRSEYDYQPIEDVMSDPLRRKILMADMKRQIDELVARYERIDEFWQSLRKVARRKKAS